MNVFQFQQKKKQNYFEGWYTRLVDQEHNLNYAFIFAITTNEIDPHAFIQIFDGTKKTNKYIRYQLDEFHYEDGVVYIQHNLLSMEKLYIRDGALEISATFKNSTMLKKHLGFQSAMRYMSLLPLVCSQEVIFLNGEFTGLFKDETDTYRIKGTTYMEKTYGHRFPKKWIWIQSNHFDKDVLLSVGVGLIPLFGKLRKGFFGIIQYKQKEYRFSLYNFSKVSISEKHGNRVIIFKNRSYTLEIEVTNHDQVRLVGPTENAHMSLDVYESINASCTLKLYKGNTLLVESKGSYVGFENMY